MDAGVQPAQVSGTGALGHSAIYLLRTTQQHHVQLSAMADQKASILMGAAFLVLTILFGQMRSGGLSVPIVTLIVFTLLAAVFAVLAVIPKVRRGAGHLEDPNPLFFGSFVEMSPQEYVAQMERIIRTEEDLHRALILDIYQMGVVLHDKKYRFLTYSYKLFLTGLLVTFVVAVIDYWVTFPGS